MNPRMPVLKTPIGTNKWNGNQLKTGLILIFIRVLILLGSLCFSYVLVRITERQTKIIQMTFKTPFYKTSKTDLPFVTINNMNPKDINSRHNKSKTKKKHDIMRKAIVQFWTFLGDSTMFRLLKSNKRELSLQKRCKILKSAGRCNFDIYRQVCRRNQRNRPTDIEGPIKYGLTHPYCTDCSD